MGAGSGQVTLARRRFVSDATETPFFSFSYSFYKYLIYKENVRLMAQGASQA